ncbi:MAG: DUF4277 domain-containing protein [Chloroflexi bacterium]|nr:DUF4277 domain-containing protein [Chloroflexota bacterium]
MTPPALTITSTRIDDIPLLIGTLIQMGVPELYDREVKDHGHHEGLSGGWLLTVWLTFILSQGDHAKSHVQEWVMRHREVLEKLIQQPIAERDLNDDRLGSVLKRLSHRERWEAFETALCSGRSTCMKSKMIHWSGPGCGWIAQRRRVTTALKRRG